MVKKNFFFNKLPFCEVSGFQRDGFMLYLVPYFEVILTIVWDFWL